MFENGDEWAMGPEDIAFAEDKIAQVDTYLATRAGLKELVYAGIRLYDARNSLENITARTKEGAVLKMDGTSAMWRRTFYENALACMDALDRFRTALDAAIGRPAWDAGALDIQKWTLVEADADLVTA